MARITMTGARIETIRQRLAYLDFEVTRRYHSLPAPGCVLDDFELFCDLVEDAIRRASWPNGPHVIARRRSEREVLA